MQNKEESALEKVGRKTYEEMREERGWLTSEEICFRHQAEYSVFDQRNTAMTDWLKENFTGANLRVLCTGKKKG